MGPDFATPQKWLRHLSLEEREFVTCYKVNDFKAPIASGSFKTSGMCIVPCSMATLAALSCGLADNLLRRAADVTLKERRPLIIAPREAPLNAIHLENMLKLSRLGAVIFPPIPAWYMRPSTLEEMENFMVNRLLDSLKLPNLDYDRWGEDKELVLSFNQW